MLSAPARVEAQDGFVKNQGQLYSKLAFTSFASKDFYTQTRDLRNLGQVFTQRNVVLYGEYGIIDSLTAIVNFPLVRTNAFANTNTIVGIGDLSLGLKYGIRAGGFNFAASVNPEFPTGNADATVQTNDTGANLVLPTGDGEFNVWSWLGASRGIPITGVSWLDGWASIGAGLNLRTKGLAHQIGLRAEVGIRFFQQVILQFQTRSQLVPSNEFEPGGFILGEGTEYVAVAALIGAKIPRTPLSLELEWAQPVASQQNLYSGPVFAAGLSVDLEVQSTQ